MKKNITLRQFGSKFIHDPTAWVLLLTNVIAGYIVLKEGWNFVDIFALFWVQNLIIGFYSAVKIYLIASPRSTAVFSALFSIVTYGLFHLGYLAFLYEYTGQYGMRIRWNTVLLYSSMFFLNHTFSFLYSHFRKEERPSVGILIWRPYLRILPMHIAVMAVGFLTFGFFGTISLLSVKTLLDLISHTKVHLIGTEFNPKKIS
jgi:hypothetical protein